MDQFSQRGFTVVELIVVVAILSIIATVIMSNSRGFDRSVLLTNLSYEVALGVRQAQVFGTSVRSFDEEFAPAHGVHFSTANPRNYLIFADVDGNDTYTGSSELVESYTISSSHSVAELCVKRPEEDERCDVVTLEILFERPNLNAVIYANVDTDTYNHAKIKVRSRDGNERIVQVDAVGRISVQ